MKDIFLSSFFLFGLILLLFLFLPTKVIMMIIIIINHSSLSFKITEVLFPFKRDRLSSIASTLENLFLRKMVILPNGLLGRVQIAEEGILKANACLIETCFEWK